LLKKSLSAFQETLTLEKVNRVRMQVGLSPVKKLERNKGILKCYEKFFYRDKLEIKSYEPGLFSFL
ncbi:MAG: hypothetical protein NTY07_07025, partial [Bacteroidia bacterium]|nr:hypothetical protein [Bacteroidia bacterium]